MPEAPGSLARAAGVPESAGGRPHRVALWALLLLGLAAALGILFERVGRERANDRVEAVLDLRSVVSLARSRGVPTDELLRGFAAQGVRSLAVDEQNLDDLALSGRARALRGLEVAELQSQGSLPATREPSPERIYLLARNPEQARTIAREAETSLGADRVRVWPAPGSTLVELVGDPRTLTQIGLGLSEELLTHLHRDLGFRVWVRPEGMPGASEPALRSRLRALTAVPGVQGVLFAGVRNEVMGYPDHLEAVARTLADLSLRMGVIELPAKVQQKGVETLARQAPEQVVRVLAVPPAQQARTDPETVVAMYSLGARERNIRLLYLRPYDDLVGELSADEANERLFTGIQRSLAPMLDVQASTFPPPRSGWLLGQVLVAAGAGAAVVLLLGIFASVPAWLAVGLVLGLAAGTALTGLAGVLEGPWRALMALGTATVLPVLGLVWQFPSLERASDEPGAPRLLLRATGALSAACLVSLAGGLMAASFLPETTYMLSLDVFRGVKVLSALVPLLVVLAWTVRRGSFQALIRLLDERLRVWHLVVLVVVGALGVFYLARTGNVSGELVVSDSERLLRRGLDALLGVRPRFKEFLLGHPALILAFTMAWLRKPTLVVLALLAAAVGQASLTGTYAHIHTPLAVSLARTGWGLVVGWGLGSLACLACVAMAGWLGPRLAALWEPVDREPGAGVESPGKSG
jgi:hypothetical protein